ncbi:MAG: DNA-directed DNA polymerase II small subunit [Candidatus Methanofastidiosia archaeon]
MASTQSCKINIPRMFLDEGVLLNEEAYAKFLEDAAKEDIILEFMTHLKKNNIFIVTKDVYEDYFYPRIESGQQKESVEQRAEFPDEASRSEKRRKSIKVKHIPSKDVDKDIKIIKDVSGKDDSEGKFEDFLSLFKDRYTRISKIFKQHSELRDFVSIKNAKANELKSHVKIVGIVRSKKTTKNGNVMLELEDLSGTIKVLISTKKERLLERAKYIVCDEVIAVSGALGEDIIFSNDFQFPDIALGRHRNVSPHDIGAVFTSDVHVGSNNFMEKSFLRFIKWLRLETGNEKQQEIASKIKYIVICGDVVDGVGIYPNQDKELCITDIYKQYEKTAQLLSYLPDWIEVIVSPGNHDATRSGNPQIPIPKAFAYDLYDMDNIHMVSNPSFFSLHGVKCLAYHGDSIFDFLSQVPGFEINKPIPPMIEMLRKRHLAPVYGKGTQIIPETSDYLCIDETPDIFQTGHTHMNGNGVYRGVTLINSGGWQSQTSFQKMRNITPDVAKVPIINLQTHNLVLMNFGD